MPQGGKMLVQRLDSGDAHDSCYATSEMPICKIVVRIEGMAKKQNYASLKDKISNSEYDRTFSFWSLDEDRALLRFYKQDGLNKLEIAKKLRRTLGSINARLKLHQNVEPDEKSPDVDFIKYIREGINPITGEELSDDSAWRHPSILDDISTFMHVSNSKQDFSKHHSEVDEAELDGIEWKILANLCQQADKFLPNESQRNIEIIQSLYQPNPIKKHTVRSLGANLGISGERVQEIKNKVLRKLLNSLVKKEVWVVDKGSTLKNKFSNDDALLYVAGVLDVIADKSKHRHYINGEDTISEFEMNESTSAAKQVCKLDYFKIEECDTITPLNDAHKFIREGVLHNREKISAFREENYKNGKLLNHGFPVTLEEENLIMEMHNQGKTDIELEQYFQRSRITITKRIEKYKQQT
jgi:hypothetical protein